MDEVNEQAISTAITGHIMARSEQAGNGQEMVRLFLDIANARRPAAEVVDLASAQGADFLRGLAQNQAAYREAIARKLAELQRQLATGAFEVESDLNALRELQTAIALGHSEVLVDTLKRPERADLLTAVEQLAHERFEATQRATQSPAAINEVSQGYNQGLLAVLSETGLSERDLSEAGPFIRQTEDNVSGGEVSQGQLDRHRQLLRQFAEIQADRFIRGENVVILRRDQRARRHETNHLSIPIPSEQQPRVREAVLLLIANVDNATTQNINPEVWVRDNMLNNDPYVNAYSDLFSRLFIGFQYWHDRDTVRSGLYESPNMPTQERASFAAGAALGSLLNGGDIAGYIDMVSQAGPYANFIGNVAAAELARPGEDLPGEARTAIAQKVLLAHPDSVLAEERSELEKRAGGKDKLDQITREMVEQVQKDAVATLEERAMIRPIGFEHDTAAIPEIRSALGHVESSSRLSDALEHTIPKLIYTEGLKKIIDQRIRKLQKAASPESVPPAVLQREVQGLLGALLSREVDDRLPNNFIEDPRLLKDVPQEYREAVYLAQFSRLMLGFPRTDIYARMRHVEAYFKRAAEFGIEKKALIEHYNMLAMLVLESSKVVKANFSQARESQIPQVCWQDVLGGIDPEVTEAEPIWNYASGDALQPNFVSQLIRRGTGQYEEKGMMAIHKPKGSSIENGMYKEALVNASKGQSRSIEAVVGATKEVFKTARQSETLRIVQTRPDALDGIGKLLKAAEKPEVIPAFAHEREQSAHRAKVLREIVTAAQSAEAKKLSVTALVAELNQFVQDLPKYSFIDKQRGPFKQRVQTLQEKVRQEAGDRIDFRKGSDIADGKQILFITQSLTSLVQQDFAAIVVQLRGANMSATDQGSRMVIQLLKNYTQPPYDSTEPLREVEVVTVPHQRDGVPQSSEHIRLAEADLGLLGSFSDGGRAVFQGLAEQQLAHANMVFGEELTAIKALEEALKSEEAAASLQELIRYRHQITEAADLDVLKRHLSVIIQTSLEASLKLSTQRSLPGHERLATIGEGTLAKLLNDVREPNLKPFR